MRLLIVLLVLLLAGGCVSRDLLSQPNPQGKAYAGRAVTNTRTGPPVIIHSERGPKPAPKPKAAPAPPQATPEAIPEKKKGRFRRAWDRLRGK